MDRTGYCRSVSLVVQIVDVPLSHPFARNADNRPIDDTHFLTAADFFKVFVFGRFDSTLSATRVTPGGHRSKNRYFLTRFDQRNEIRDC